MPLETLIFSFSKRYSLPVLIMLYLRNGLTFDKIYDISVDYRAESLQRGKGAFMERRGKYGAISRESISRAIGELLKTKRIRKEARLMGGKAYVTYVLTDETKKLMNSYFKDVR